MITFERVEGDHVSFLQPELMSPGHPLLSSLVDAVDGEFGDALSQGVLLEDDRESDDYTVVTLEVEAHDDRPKSLLTMKVRPGGEPERVNPALYTSLGAGQTVASSGEVSATNDAIATAQATISSRPVKFVAVAHVLGTATPEASQAWHSARRLLREELLAEVGMVVELVEAIPGDGWDYMVSANEVRFFSATPPGHGGPRRRAEKQAAANVGERYEVRTLGV